MNNAYFQEELNPKKYLKNYKKETEKSVN